VRYYKNRWMLLRIVLFLSTPQDESENRILNLVDVSREEIETFIRFNGNQIDFNKLKKVMS
jgi:hypothetical protein